MSSNDPTKEEVIAFQKKAHESVMTHGGPAFPFKYQTGIAEGVPCWNLYRGMSLRDYFAAKAMQGWLASFETENGEPEVSQVVKLAYNFADAMLAERNKIT